MSGKVILKPSAAKSVKSSAVKSTKSTKSVKSVKPVKPSKFSPEYREELIDKITDTVWQTAKDEMKESEVINDYYDVTEPGDLDENDYETKEEYKEAYDDCELWHDTVDELYENFTESANRMIKCRDWHSLLMLIREIAELPENIYTHEVFTSLLFDCLPKPDNEKSSDDYSEYSDSDDEYED